MQYIMAQTALNMMKFIVNHLDSFTDLRKFVPPEDNTHLVVAKEVVPMAVLLKDEKFVTETIDILAQLTKDANLIRDPQVNSVH